MIKTATILLIISVANSVFADVDDNNLFEQFGCIPNTPGDNHSWVVLLKHLNPSKGTIRPICSGVLIHPQYVLTTGHCLEKDIHSVYIGGEDYSVTSQKIHENYDRSKKYNDIGLVKLTKPMEKVKPICLPFTKDFHEKVPKALDVVTFDVKNLQTNSLPVTQSVATHSLDDCTQYFNKFTATTYLDDGYLCAGDIDILAGTSGAPAQGEKSLNGKSIYVLYGLVAQGVSSKESDRLAAYTNVPHYMLWILKNTN